MKHLDYLYQRKRAKAIKQKLRTDASFRRRYYKDAGLDDAISALKGIAAIAAAIGSTALAAKTSLEAAKKTSEGISKAKSVFVKEGGTLKDLGKKLISTIAQFFKAKIKLIFKIKTGGTDQPIEQ